MRQLLSAIVCHWANSIPKTSGVMSGLCKIDAEIPMQPTSPHNPQKRAHLDIEQARFAALLNPCCNSVLWLCILRGAATCLDSRSRIAVM